MGEVLKKESWGSKRSKQQRNRKDEVGEATLETEHAGTHKHDTEFNFIQNFVDDIK